MSTTNSYATFYADKFYFGILTSEVLELTKVTDITPVPLAPPTITGLINLRGQIVTAVNMRRRLAVGQSDCQGETTTILIEKSGVMYGLLVDRVSDILELDEKDFETPPSSVSAEAKELIVGVSKLPGELLFILDTTKIISGISGDK
ncbi:MAG: chemotaxis protein CheW [Betaproteobacteria bacterium]